MIDIDKFICSLLADHPVGVTVREDIHKALKDQGLEYKGGKIVPIEDKISLPESGDERIRKYLTSFVELNSGVNLPPEDAKKILGWIDKQGERKPTDKVEPKFKVGDIVKDPYGDIYHIIEINNDSYKTDDGRFILFENEDAYRLWTIKDAKDGDVLCTYECDEPKIVFILKGTPKKHYALSYHCYYNIMYPHFGSDSEKGCLAPNDEDVKPATKEQRDTLERAMTDAGYTFDFDKKELKKIEQKPAWSEKDEAHIDSLLKRLEGITKPGAAFISTRFAISEDMDWLKSLKDRYAWKPSEEQIIALRQVISGCSYDIEPLVELETKLKEL